VLALTIAPDSLEPNSLSRAPVTNCLRVWPRLAAVALALRNKVSDISKVVFVVLMDSDPIANMPASL
jgi:hypothetical protein